MSRRFLRNAAASYGERLLLVVSALLLTPYLFRSLGPAGFGTWSVMFTVTTVFNLLEVGFAAGVTRDVAAHDAAGDRGRLEAVVRTGAVLTGLLGVAALLVSVAIGLAAPGLAAPAYRDDFQAGMLILGASMLVRFSCVSYGAALAGFQRYDLYSAALGTTTVAAAVGSVLALETGGSVLGVAVAYAIAFVLGGVTFALGLRRVQPELTLRPSWGRSPVRRRLARFSSATLVADAMVFVGQRLDTVIVASLRGATAAAPLGAASKLTSGLQALTLPVMTLLMPMSSELQARGNIEEVARRHELATRFSAQLTVPVALAVALFATDIVNTWLGPRAPDVTAAIITLLALQTMFIAATPAEKVLVGLGHVRTVAIVNAAEGLLNVALSITLVVAHGPIGAAIGSLAASVLLGPVKWPLACRATGRRLRSFLRDAPGRALAMAVPSVAAMLAVRSLLEPGALRLALGAGIGLVLAAATAAPQLRAARAVLAPAGRTSV